VDLRRAKRTNRADGVQQAALGFDATVRPGQPMLCKNRSFVVLIGNSPPRRVAGDILHFKRWKVFTLVSFKAAQTQGNTFKEHYNCISSNKRHSGFVFFHGCLDDCLVHEKIEDELLQALHAFFSVYCTFCLKGHALKTDLFSTHTSFCGRFFDKNGIRFRPSKFDDPHSMQRPELACDLAQFTCPLNWMRTNIPNYVAVAAPLLGLLEDCYSEVGGRTKKTLRQFL
jgi:hypothetical protein